MPGWLMGVEGWGVGGEAWREQIGMLDASLTVLNTEGKLYIFFLRSPFPQSGILF